MSKHTQRSLSLADRMAEAGVDPLLVAEARTLVRGYGAQRMTNSRLWTDNQKLRERTGCLMPRPIKPQAELIMRAAVLQKELTELGMVKSGANIVRDLIAALKAGFPDDHER
jgi:hypothetical protein